MVDIVYEHDGVCNVVELKTGKKYEDHALQRSLYGLAGALLYPDVDMINVRTVYLDGGMTDELSFSSGQVTTYKYIWQRFINKCQPPQPHPPGDHDQTREHIQGHKRREKVGHLEHIFDEKRN